MSEQEQKDLGGRPTDYREEYDMQAFRLCLLGAKDTDLAKFFEVVESTINLWKKEHPTFSESIKAGKEDADANVADSLYKAAKGYSAKDTKFATYEGKITDSQEYIKHYPPDTRAAIFWLKNRTSGKYSNPDMKWSDKQEHEVTGRDGKPIEQINYNLDAEKVKAFADKMSKILVDDEDDNKD